MSDYNIDEHFNELISLVQKYGLSNPQYVWQNVITMEELFYCNKEYIKNNLSESFYNFAKLAPDSQPLANYLLKLHNKGVFTFDGQGSLMNYDKLKGKEWVNYERKDANEHNRYNNYFYSIEQKPYLSCIIKKEYLNDLLEYLKNINESISNDKINYIITGNDIKFTNIDMNKYNVTRTKFYKKLSEESTSEWQYPTNLWPNESFSNYICEFCDYIDLYNDVIIIKYVALQLVAQNYGSNIVLEKVLLDFFTN